LPTVWLTISRYIKPVCGKAVGAAGSEINSAKHRPGFGAEAPYKTKETRNRKAENNSNAVLLLFFALRQPARSATAQQKPVALLYVHPAFVVLIKAFDLI
jgi:hypothetical protein